MILALCGVQTLGLVDTRPITIRGLSYPFVVSGAFDDSTVGQVAFLSVSNAC